MTRTLFFLLLISSIIVAGQKPIKPTSSEIYEDLQKLNFLGTALYIAAHPDDENTGLISYLSNDVKARTGYLSLTRGDGGQNLIGSEIREMLGVIRTQELLAARKLDGGEQLFTRANDFGYSKLPEETMEIWNEDAVLSDVVLAIRKFRPDVIINRFNHKPESFGTTHGHHTASAVLSEMAFDLAADPSKYTDQLNRVAVWQPKRLFFNTFWWFYGSKEKFDAADKSNMLKLEIGTFYPSSGLSNGEISSLSRSMHKSQGFGSAGSRGQQEEYLEIVKGELPTDNSNLFEGIDTSWSRVDGGEEIEKVLKKVESKFDFKNPSASVLGLIAGYKLIQDLEDDYWRIQKTKEVKALILACTGLFLEAVAADASGTRGSEVKLSIEIVNRSAILVKLRSVKIPSLDISKNPFQNLSNNQDVKIELQGVIPNDLKYTSPYWLKETGTIGMYTVSDKNLIGVAGTPHELTANFILEFEGYPISFEKDIIYKRTDPVKGEVYQPFEIIPAVTASISDKVLIFSNDNSKEISVTVKAGTSNIYGKIQLSHSSDWMVIPRIHEVKISEKGGEQKLVFTVTPPKNQSSGKLAPVITLSNQLYSNELIEIDYDHIPIQKVLLPSESKVVRLDIENKGNLIGYVQGAGDAIPASLRQVGYTVVELKSQDLTADNLKRFDAIVMGVRAYNTHENLKFYQKALYKYVEDGGTLMVQYNTNHRLMVDNVAPFELKLGRDRVTDENSEVRIIEPDHQVMQFPNKITEADFDGWVQERGLYFPSEWSDDFTPILSMHDPNEAELKGSLLIANYGKGHFIYTGLSFFRELPAGVPGAYRLYVNLLSIGKNNEELKSDTK